MAATLVCDWLWHLPLSDWKIVKEFGLEKIVHLAKIEIPESIPNYLAGFWRKEIRVLRINDCDFCPVVEEFLFFFDHKLKNKIVLPPIEPLIVPRDLAKFLCISEDEAMDLINDSELNVRWICEDLRDHPNPIVRGRAFVLAFTGQFLFSNGCGMCPLAVVPILIQALNGLSIVPLVLGQLLVSLDKFQSRGYLSCPTLFAVRFSFLLPSFILKCCRIVSATI